MLLKNSNKSKAIRVRIFW